MSTPNIDTLRETLHALDAVLRQGLQDGNIQMVLKKQGSAGTWQFLIAEMVVKIDDRLLMKMTTFHNLEFILSRES
jgi:hypothetical protein